MNKFKAMMILQGGTEDQLLWLAAQVGRLYEETEVLKVQVANLRAARTREKKLKKKKSRGPK